MDTVSPVAPPHQEASSPQLKITSAKTLAESTNLASIPSHYAFTTPTSGDQAVHPDHDDSIPVIDFSLLSSSNPDQRCKAVSDLAKACEDWGIFMLINHGVPESQMKATVDALMGFFDLTEERKNEFQGKHLLDPIIYGTSFRASVDKVFLWRDFLKMMVYPKFHCPPEPEGMRKHLTTQSIMWDLNLNSFNPSDARALQHLGFREVLAEYTGKLRKLARELLKGVSESLGLGPGYIDEAMNIDSSLQILAANLYPPCPQPELAVGLPSHSDIGLLTILMQNDISGLQVHHGGKWVKVDPIPNAFVVNTADQLEIMSNGKYKSALHRAIVNNKTTRISIPFSTGPSLDTVVVPAEQLVDGKHNQATDISMNYKEYMEFKQSTVLHKGLCPNQVKI